MEDVKQFNELLVKRDKTILGAASNLFLALKARWPELKDVLDEMSVEALKLRARLGEEGWKGYNPKPISIDTKTILTDPIALHIHASIEKQIDADKLAKEIEAKRLAKEKALAEKQRVADEKAEEKAEFDAELKRVKDQRAEKRAIAAAKQTELEDAKAKKKAELKAQLAELEELA